MLAVLQAAVTRLGGGPAGETAGAADDPLASLESASDEEMFAFIDEL